MVRFPEIASASRPCFQDECLAFSVSGSIVKDGKKPVAWIARKCDDMVFSRQVLQSAYLKFLDRLSEPVVGHGLTEARVMALTFDDGPNLPYTRDILQILEQYGVKATFFLLGKNVRAFPSVAKAIAQAGHVVGNHTYTHPRRVQKNPLSFYREIIHTHRLISKTTGEKPRMFRPPYVQQDPWLFALLRVIMRYQVVLWSASGKDWTGEDAEAITGRILNDVEPGGIIDLHDGSEDIGDKAFSDRSQTVIALPMLIERLREQGYRFVTIPELIGLNDLRRREV